MRTKINLIKESAKFSETIIFENLKYYELGGLLFVLRLKSNLYTNIRMDEPLGLGIIKIKPILYILDVKKRYTSFSDNDYIEKKKRKY